MSALRGVPIGQTFTHRAGSGSCIITLPAICRLQAFNDTGFPSLQGSYGGDRNFEADAP